MDFRYGCVCRLAGIHHSPGLDEIPSRTSLRCMGDKHYTPTLAKHLLRLRDDHQHRRRRPLRTGSYHRGRSPPQRCPQLHRPQPWPIRTGSRLWRSRTTFATIPARIRAACCRSEFPSLRPPYLQGQGCPLVRVPLPPPTMPAGSWL